MSETQSKVEAYLLAQRDGLTRLSPQEAADRIASSEAVLIDTRPEAYRQEEGAIPGAVVIERCVGDPTPADPDRNVLEWRLDPTSPDCIPQARTPGFAPIIMCNEGYASSLAAKVLVDLGVKASDLDGGFRRWKGEGLPVERAVTKS
ncbi:hypothetical protein IAU60_004372 [Kwoniella sp. DSM 27419]